MALLLTLPEELWFEVFKHLEFVDKVRLSATCKEYRTRLSPEIFKTICFTNSEALAKSALAAVQAHGDYTTCIEFTCYSGSSDELTTPALPPTASKVLEGHLTPNLRTVRLRFDFDFDGTEDWDDHPHASMGASIYLFEAIEDEDYVRAKEQQWKWRALMKETWQALAANKAVRELILDDFIPKWTSTFRTDEFRQFLSRIESATFNILGLDNGAGWHANTVWGYIEFLSSLDASFFHHMSGLKHLYIQASDPLGLEGFRHIPLALKPGDMPVLESLTLQNCFISPELVSFIQGHSQLLKSLDIGECVSAGDGTGMAQNPLYWAEFFDEIYKAKPALTELIAGGGRVPLTADEEFKPDYAYTNEPENVQDIRRRLKVDPTLKLFGYSYLDDKYGMFFMLEEENVEQFNNGNDQRAYDRLMGLIKENAARAGQ